MINIYDLTGSEQFKTLPYERKQYVLNRYFTDFVSSDKRFLSLSDGGKKKAYSTFMKTHLGEPPMTPKEQAAYAQMVEADTITPEKAEQYNKQIELGRQSSDVIDIAPKLSLPKDYTPADTSKMDKESKKQYYRAAESLQIAKQLGNKESAEHWEGMLRHYKNKDEYDRTGVIISTAGQEAVRKQNLEFMASATRSDFPLEPTYPQQQLTKIKEKEAVEERKEQFYEKREQEDREQAISYQDNNRRLMRLALIKSSWTPEQNAEYGKLLKEQGEIEEYFKSGGLTPRQRDAIMMGSKAAKERNLASSMADAFLSGTLQFVTSPYTVFIPSSGISDYMYYYDMGYGLEVGAIESLFRGTVSSLPMNLMMMVNPAVGVALTMSSITSGGIKEDYEAGMLDAQTIMTNILSGAVQTAIEYMSADAQKAIYTKTFRTGGMKALQDAVHEDVKNVFFPTFKSFASAFGASAVEEGMEEIYQNVADRIIRATVNDEEMPDLKEWVPELAYEFAGGFLGAALTGTAFSAIQISQSKKMQQNITKYANQGYEYAQLTQNAIDAVNAGNYDQAFNLISQAQDAAREIGNPNKQVLQGIGTVQSAIMMYDKNKIVVTEAIIDAHEIRAKELRQELAELKKARYVNEDAALSRDARVLEIQEELVEIRDNILARQQSLVANEHVAVMKKSMDKMIERIEANPELAEKYALQAAQAQESALLSTREISERDKAGLQAGISTEDDYRTAVDRHFTEGLADEVIEMEMKPGDFAPSRIEPYVYTDINIDESVTPKKTKEKKTDVKSEAKEDKEMAKPEPLAEDTLKTIKAEADKAIASKDKANLQKAKKTLDEALKENKDQRLLDIRRSLNSEIADIVEQERAVKEKEKAKKAKKAKEEADKQQREDMTKRRKDELITKGIEAAAEKYGINIKQYETRSEIADAIIERQDAVRKSLAEHRRAMGTDYEKIKEAARELEVPIKGKKEVLKQEVLKAREAQIIKEISTKETLHHERGLLKEYNESMKPKVDETVQKIDGIVQEVKDTRIDLSRETDEAKRSEYEAEISKNVKEIDSVIAELKSIQKEAGDNYIAVEKIQAEINKLEKVARPLSEADVTQRTDVNLNKANELIDTRSIEETGVIPEAQIGDTATVSKENDNFEITYILVPIDEVVTSHNIDTLNQNENYPAELQNRVRENHAEDVNKIAAKLNPRILMHNDIASDGRPIGFIGKDGKVYIIAGNGRTIALKMRADGQYGNLNQYEQVLKSNLKELGFQDQDVAGKMLVGIYNGREDLVKLAISLNRGETQALSETEAARTDARTLIKLDESGDGIIRMLSRKGDILSESNNKFINAFIDEVVPESERSKYRTKGTISVKVEERIKNALFMYVFDDSSKAASLLSSLKDVGDSNVKSMLHGIMENVKEMALLKYLDASYDFSSDLIDAVHETESLRAKGENLDIAQNQMDMFADNEVKSHLLTAVYRIKSPKEAAGFVKAYTEISLEYADGGQDTMDFAKLTKEQIRAEFLKRWLFGEIKDMKSAKEAYIKARELTVHKPLAELEFTLYEAMAEQLAPRMGLTVDEYFAKYFDVFTTEAQTETETEASEQSIEYQLQAEGEVRYQKSKTAPKKVVQAYRMGILNEDGTLSPVMVDTKTTKPRYEIGQWYDAEVRKSTMKVIPGFHFAETPSLSQLYKKDGTLAKGRVYYIAEYSADKSYQAEADAAGGNLENQIPTDGYYFRGKMGKGGWAISGKMRPVRILSMQEVDAINRKAGIETINGMPIEKYNKMQAETRHQTENKELLTIHNLSEDKLREAIKQGGMPMPSLAIINTKQTQHDEFGEISLIASPSILQTSRKSPVYSQDAWTQTYPTVYHRVEESSMDNAKKIAEKINKRYKTKVDTYEIMNDAQRQNYTGTIEEIITRIVKKSMNGDTFDDDDALKYARYLLKSHPLETREEIRGPNDKYGNARYRPNTAEEVMKMMRHDRNRADKQIWEVRELIGKIAPKFSSMSDVNKNKWRLMSKEARNNAVDSTMEKIQEIVKQSKEKRHEYRSLFATTDVANDIYDIAQGKERQVRERYAPDTDFSQFHEIIREIKKIPTDIFEAKPDRVVNLNEFTAAIVPYGTDKKVINALKKDGIQISFYEKGNEVDRHAKTVNEAEKRNILFQSQESVQKLIKGYVERMPNGKYRVGFMDADATTGLHEQGHIGKDMLYEMAKIDPAWERYVKIAEEFCGVGEDGVWTTDAEEKFANGYVKYITEGKAPTPQLKTVFEKLKDLISKAVSKIAEIMNIELTDDIREVYGALLGAEITTKEDTRKAKVDAFITKVDAADFASKDVDVLTKRLDSEFGPQSRFMTDRKLSRGKVHMNIIDIDMGNTIVNIAQVDDGYIVNGEHAYNNGEAMDIVNKLIDDYAPGDIDMGEKDSTRFQMPSYARDTNLIRYQKSDAYEKKQKFIQEQNETNAKIIREELDTAPSAEKAKEAVVNAIKRALMINYEGAEAMDVIKRREIARAIKEQQKLGNTEAVEKLKAALELMRKRDQRFRDILREETGFRNINNITLEQALKMLDRVDPVLYDRFVNESTRKVLVNSINLLESMGKKGFVYDKNTLDLFFDYFTSEHVDTVKRSSLSTLFLMPQRYLVETFGKAGQKLVELAYLGTAKRSDYEHQYHPSLQRIYDLQMTNKNGRGRAYRGEEIDAIGRTILEVDGNSRIAQEDKLNTIQSVLEQWAEDNGTVINKGDIEDMYNAKQDIIAIFEGIIVEFNNSPIAKLHGIEIGLLEEYGNPRTYEQASSTEPGKDKILHVPANVKERIATDYNAEAKHNTNLYEVYLSYAASMAKYMAFYELAAYMEGNEELIPGSGESEGTVIVPAQFFRDISSIQRVAAKGALRENGYVHKYIKNVIGYGEEPTSATRMFGALKTITFASTLVPSIPMTILNFHQRTLIDTQVGAEIAWQVRKDIKFFSGRGRFDSEAFPTLSRIMDMYRGADTSLIAETASAAQKSATEGGRSWFAKMYYKGAEFSAKMLEASPFSKAELGNRAYAHLAGIYQIVTQTAEYKQARKEGMKFRQAVEHVLTNHDNIRQDAIHNGGVVNAEINADVNPAFAPQIFWKDTSVHKYLMFVRYGITLAQLEMRKFAAPFLSMKSRQSQQIYDMLRSGNIQAADHAQYIQAAQIMLKMTDERARSKMLAEGKIDSKKMSDKRLSIQEVESFHNMLQQILDESIDVAKEKHSDVIKGTKTETLEAAQMMNFTIRELMLRTILVFVISMLPTWRKDKKEIDIIAMLSELNTYIGLFQTPQMITDFRLGGAMVPRLEYYYKDKQIIKGLTDWALRSLPGIGILNNFVKGITGKAISDDIVDAAYPSKQQKGKRNK